MRLAGQEIMGYYPTPRRITDMIIDRLDFPPAKLFAALDPCAGTGEVLAQATTGTGAETYGIEIDEDRAAQAQGNIHHVLSSSLEEAKISHAVFSLIWLNPPYDGEHELRQDGAKKTTRKEITFLRRCLPFLAPAGILIYIVPRHILDADTIYYLAENLESLEIWDFPEPERQRFGQAVAIGARRTRRHSPDILPRIAETSPTDSYGQANYKPAFTVPPGNPNVQIFRTNRLDPRELLKQSPTSPLWTMFEQQARTLEDRRPPLALHAGHLGLLLAAGCADGIVGSGPDRHLVRGKTAKDTNTTVETSTTEKGNALTVTRIRDKYVIALKVLRHTGEILELR